MLQAMQASKDAEAAENARIIAEQVIVAIEEYRAQRENADGKDAKADSKETQGALIQLLDTFLLALCDDHQKKLVSEKVHEHLGNAA